MIRINTALATIIKTRLLAIPVKLTPQLVGLDSRRKIKALLQKEIHLALEELSRTKNV